MTPRFKPALLLILVGTCLWSVLPAAGYVPPGELILDRMTSTLGQTGKFSVVHTTAVGDRACPALHEATATETAWYDPPDRFRFESVSEKTKRIHVATPEATLTVVDGHVVSTAQSPLMGYREPLLCRDRKLLAARLAGMGIDTTVSSLGRLDGTVAYVVGARFPDTSASQIWVDKETFLPFRLITHDPREKTPVEARYSQWHKAASFWFPMHIEIYRNHRLIQTICSHAVTKKSAFESGLFDIPALQRRYPPAGAAEGRPPDSGTDEIQQAIDEFNKLYE
ncbi:MAG: hypothetical protein SWC96_00640 [Thermodesulfobacteriota bacterium]|nr:hypothetical protein [Thermodesulfobacteriota bacterium]